MKILPVIVAALIIGAVILFFTEDTLTLPATASHSSRGPTSIL